MAGNTPRRHFTFARFPITVDPFLPLVVVLMAWILSEHYFPELIYYRSDTVYWIMGITSSLFLTISIFIHELGHAVTAKKLHLPLERIHLFLFGGMAELKHRPVLPKQELYIALAGPVASIAFAFFSLGISQVFTQLPDEIILVLRYVFYMNLLLGLFNMLPIFPLDGGRALRAYLWKYQDLFHKASQLTLRVSAVVIIVLFTFTGFSALFMSLNVTLWIGLLTVYLTYTAWTGKRELLYEPEIEDLVFEFEKFGSTQAMIDEIAELDFSYLEHCVFPILDNGKMISVVNGRDLVKDNYQNWEPLIRMPRQGEYIIVEDDQTYLPDMTYRAEFVPVIIDGKVAGLGDAHELRFWLNEKEKSNGNS